jgi:hypothetical protein
MDKIKKWYKKNSNKIEKFFIYISFFIVSLLYYIDKGLDANPLIRFISLYSLLLSSSLIISPIYNLIKPKEDNSN